MSGLASVTSAPLDPPSPRNIRLPSGVDASFWQGRDQVQGLQHVARLRLASETMRENCAYFAGSVNPAQRPIDRKAKIAVAARQRKSIRFNREIIVGESQLARRAALRSEVAEDSPVAEISDDLSLIEHREPLLVRLGGDDFSIDVGAGERIAQTLLGRCAGQHADLFAR